MSTCIGDDEYAHQEMEQRHQRIKGDLNHSGFILSLIIMKLENMIVGAKIYYCAGTDTVICL